MISLFFEMLNKLGMIILLTAVITKFRFFKGFITKDKYNKKEILLSGIFFGMIGILGTYFGIHINGAIVNARIIGPAVGGFFGGPIVGLLAGLIAGTHRFLIDINGFTSLPCALSTLLEGIIAGLLSKYFYKSSNKWVFGFSVGLVSEFMHMILVLIIARPFVEAFDLVKIIAFPMMFSNSLGIALFIAFIESIYKEQEAIAAHQAQTVLKIAKKTLKYLRNGLDEKTAKKTVELIYNSISISAVAITNRENRIAAIGDNVIDQNGIKPIKNSATKEVIESGKYIVLNSNKGLECLRTKTKLKSAVIVPLKEEDEVIGTLKLYKKRQNAINTFDVELANGLASLFATQLALSKISKQEELLAKSELRSLQAQINPHFLFNAINTIVSFTRTDPDKARETLLNLGEYFRNNMLGKNDDIDIRKEINTVMNYVEIEKARFGDKLSVKCEVDEDVECMIPPLLIQPLVENAIKHGIFEKINGGEVEIFVRNSIEGTTITVKDNGVGIKKYKLNSILHEKKGNSIGLSNVNSRLMMKYGKQYGLNLESKENIGTSVSFIIPNLSKKITKE
ncbi:LytS/YhcK type 5TM receptor domain-containing protein [Helicovermis profundi]|uniref:histidine kinase n=1 Tax=Helicovermis profundi TaxID=3065157 RepID=A0AAU9E9Q6_9FIRM|nr:sensor histidine kinase [Clostridia bacterium S502]